MGGWFSKSDWLDKCAEDDHNDSRCTSLNVIRISVGLLSFFCSAFMIFIIWAFKRYLFFSQRLLLFLSIAGMLDTLPYIMGSVESDIKCKIQGYLMTYFDWVCVGWISVITANIYRLVKHEKSYESQEMLFHLVCWFLPLIIAGIPLLTDSYGHSGPWCWIKGDTPWDNVMRFLVWYGPVLVIVISLTAILVYLRIHTKRERDTWSGYSPEEENAKWKKWKEVRILFLYPIVFICISFFPLITRIHMALNTQSNFVLVLLTSITAPLLGTANTLLYSCGAEMRAQIRPKALWEELRHRRHRTEGENYPVIDDDFNEATRERDEDIMPYDQ